MALTKTGTYVYCVVSARRPPALRGVPKGLPGTGRVRLLAIDAAGNTMGKWLVVADAPLGHYGAAQVNRKLSDLEWVSQMAMAHEAVVEAFVRAPAVLPAKLFTIFTSDERAVQDFAGQPARLNTLVKRVLDHDEWGLRVTLDKRRLTGPTSDRVRGRTNISGADYLVRKKAMWNAMAELSETARTRVASLYDEAAGVSTLARRRASSDVAGGDRLMLLDAVFLVSRRRVARFRRVVGQLAKKIDADGCAVVLTGPWPPYGFMQE